MNLHIDNKSKISIFLTSLGFKLIEEWENRWNWLQYKQMFSVSRIDKETYLFQVSLPKMPFIYVNVPNNTFSTIEELKKILKKHTSLL